MFAKGLALLLAGCTASLGPAISPTADITTAVHAGQAVQRHPITGRAIAPTPGSVRATARTAAGTALTAGSVVRAGQTLAVTTYGFRPGERVAFRLGKSTGSRSSGVASSTGISKSNSSNNAVLVTADAAGDARLTYRVPGHLAPGRKLLLAEQGAADRAGTAAGTGNVTVTVPRFAILAFTTG